ncbi:MAG TPA: M28 family peptidase [Gaiellaceae bacterium]|nr:M28 family peptidase [Gaiellaceae bacterium]
MAVPVLVAAFSVGRPDPLPEPRLRPFFDQTTAVQFATIFANRFPDRTPGSQGAREATTWVEDQLAEYGFAVERDTFTADIPGIGTRELVNLVAVAPRGPAAAEGAEEVAEEPPLSQRAIVVVAHRDNLGESPGAQDNASGTAALLELARDLGTATLSHHFVLVSTDGGAFGALGAARFAERSPWADRLAAVVVLDTLGGPLSPRLEFGGTTARVPSATLLTSAADAVSNQTGAEPLRPGAFAQLIDLAFPFNLHEHAPFVSQGAPAVTLTTGSSRPRPPEGDTLSGLDGDRLGELGRASQSLLGALDEAAEVTRGTHSYLYLGTRLVHGWTIQFVLIAALLPFLAATIDLFARCRRRHIALWPGLRSYLSRLSVWLWAGAAFAVLVLAGILPRGEARPIALDTAVAAGWPYAALGALLGVSLIAWLVVRPRLAPTRSIAREEELGGHLAAMLVLALVALVVAAVNPYSLVFLLPALHAWLWIPQVADRGRIVQGAVYALGFAGPALLFASFALRFDLGTDAAWYILALTAVGYVPLPLVLSFLASGAAAGQLGALAAGRYAPYPDATERSRGPIREATRQAILVWRRSRRRHLRPVDAQEPGADTESVESP